MTIFNALSLIGGLCLFLFGMNVMGQSLERRAGSGLRNLLGKLTSKWYAGFLTGLGVTAVIQSSSATTVMVVGFVNSGIMTLRQAINVIMGANVGTTVTSLILSLNGIEGDGLLLQLLKPDSFTPVLALVGIGYYMFSKNSKSKDTGEILLGFATLMFGMSTMSDAVAGLKDVEAFTRIFTLFENPILGVLAGAVLTAIIQSSSASVGILQALSATGSVTVGAAIPIIMGQNIGTCVTALISSVGANKNAKRAAGVHLLFNVIGTVAWLIVFWIIKLLLAPVIFTAAASEFSIFICHATFNILCTILLLPMARVLEKIVIKLVPDSSEPEIATELDERLLATPPIALDRCRKVTIDMANMSVAALRDGITALKEYTPELAESVRDAEGKTDRYEDILGTYLVRLSSLQTGDHDSAEATKLLKLISDFERISDHGVNLVESAEELRDKKIVFTDEALKELDVLYSAVEEILTLSLTAFVNDDLDAAMQVEPLEQVIDLLKEKIRTNHIVRLQQGLCTIDAGFVLSDLLTGLERTSDHCSNIAGCVIDIAHNNMNIHQSLNAARHDSDLFKTSYQGYLEKYAI
ncbi:MAG: Na/Pi cotransporter family protein [Clostridia bacterium]|nr:Na/Pi cotransporter family protein [Clostridia bacterium]